MSSKVQIPTPVTPAAIDLKSDHLSLSDKMLSDSQAAMDTAQQNRHAPADIRRQLGFDLINADRTFRGR